MVRRRITRRAVIPHHTAPDQPSSSNDDGQWSSDDGSSPGQSPQVTDYGSSSSATEGESSSYSESEPETITASGRFGIQMRRLGRTTLLKLVKSRHPKLENAKDLLNDLTRDKIADEFKLQDNLGNSVIHYACMKTLVPWLELIIEYDGNLEVKGAGGRRPIHFVVRDKAKSESEAKDKVHMIELLASKRALFVNERDSNDRTPLQLACNHSKSRGQKMVIEALLGQPDIKVNAPVKIGGVNSSLLNVVCHNEHFDTALLLLEHGANPLEEDSSKDTPFFIIVRKKNVKYALRFLQTCEKKRHNMKKILSAKNVHDRTAFHEAIKIGHEALVKYCIACLAPEDGVDGRDDHDYLLDYKARNEANVMHTACMKGHISLAILFCELCPKLLEQKTVKGLTPLHYACRENYPELAEEICSLLQSRDIDLPLSFDDEDVVDGSPCLLKFTALRGSRDCLIVLLKRVKDQSTILKLLKWISAEKNLHKVLEEFLNKFDSIFMGNDVDQEIKNSVLLCAAKGKTKSLQQFVGWRKATTFLFKDDQGNNLMHLIAQGGHLDTALAMLKKDDVEYRIGNTLGQTPLHLAIKRGHRQMVELFLKTNKSMAGDTDCDKVTPLMYACQRGDLFIVDLLLEQGQDEIKFFDNDCNGLNCLDHAINSSHERVAVKLLSQEDWRRLLTHSSYDERGRKMTPMRKLIESMPGVCKFVLDKCIKNLPRTDHDVYKVELDYELLEDWFSPWMKDRILWPARENRGRSLDGMATRGYDMILHAFSHGSPDDVSNGPETVSTNFQDNGRLKDGAQITVTHPVYRYEMHPLRLMINSDESKELLNHPLVRLFIRHKQKSTRLTYWINFFLTLTLLILVTGHSLVIPPPFYVQPDGDGRNYSWLADGETKWQENLDPVALILFGQIGIWIILTLTITYFLLFLYRVWMHRHSTLSSINGLLSVLREIAVQLFTILFILPGFSDKEYNGVTLKADWQWQLGAFAVFLAWFNFIMSLQKFPFIGIYVLMFKEVLSTLLNFILVAGVFCLSFAVVFCILLLNQIPFHTLGDSLGKTVAMMTGEIDYSSVFNNLDYLSNPNPSDDFTSLVFFPISTHLILVIFIVFLPILIMNLLTGLAVYDVEVIQTKAKLYKRTLEALDILDFQDNMFMLMWRGSVVKSDVVQIWTKISSWSKLLYKVTGYKEIHDQLKKFLEDLERTEGESVEFLETTDMKIEEMAKEINKISKRQIGLGEDVVKIKAQLSMTQ